MEESKFCGCFFLFLSGCRPGVVTNMISEQERSAILAEYAVGNTVLFGHQNGRPISWQVIDENGKFRMLLAKEPVAQQPYHERYFDTSWQTCSLRKWLNGTFVREAFSMEEQTRILATRVENLPNPKYYTNGGENSVDKLFILSLAEVEKYLPSDALRAAGAWWWLRTPGSNLLSAASVYEDGSIYDTGININYTDGGVRPALWLRLKV